jgi:hypothetical protein
MNEVALEKGQHSITIVVANSAIENLKSIKAFCRGAAFHHANGGG